MKYKHLSPELTRREDLVWLAGVLDAGASLDLHRGRYPRVRFASTDRDVTGRVATLLGGRVRLSLKPAPYAATWHCEVSGAHAAQSLRAVLPFLGARRSAEAATLLGGYELGAARTGPGPKIVRPPALR